MPATLTPVEPAQAPDRMTRPGRYTPRLSRDELLDLLGRGEGREATRSRLEEYRRLFAYRYTGAIVTRAGCGPGGWTAFKRPLKLYQIALHLLADRVPGRPPVWYGSRSLARSRYFCLDVDADRTAEQILAKKFPSPGDISEEERAAELRKIAHRLADRPAKPSQEDRVALVNQALRRMGINPGNPRSVLDLGSPGGGRHIYVFFDALYSLDQYHELLRAAGLRHTPGEIEFYPSVGHGLRLPFGYLPGRAHDPDAWVQFIDDFRNGRIICHSLAELHANLEKHRSTQFRRIESRRAAAAPERRRFRVLDIPRQPEDTRPSAGPPAASDREQRFLRLLDGVHSIGDAQELLDLGILVDGSRTRVLNHLAAHLIWFKGLTAEDAAQFLTEWAMSPRHLSKDIAADLADGTTVVAEHIRRLCRWYESRKRAPEHARARDANEFSPRELDALRPSLDALTGEERHAQAVFLLHFLRFAKRHGAPADDGTGWEASPAIRQVVRRWPGCHHLNYKSHMAHAISAGGMTVVKGAWHRPNGPGRARTYRLSVPVVSPDDCTLTYDAALDFLAGRCPTPEQPGIDTGSSIPEDTRHADHGERPRN